MKVLQDAKGRAASELAHSLFQQPALVPASPWLSNRAPRPPVLNAASDGHGLKITWHAGGSDPVRLWVLQRKEDHGWATDVLPGSQSVTRLTRIAPPSMLALRAVDRCGSAESADGDSEEFEVS